MYCFIGQTKISGRALFAAARRLITQVPGGEGPTDQNSQGEGNTDHIGHWRPHYWPEHIMMLVHSILASRIKRTGAGNSKCHWLPTFHMLCLRRITIVCQSSVPHTEYPVEMADRTAMRRSGSCPARKQAR